MKAKEFSEKLVRVALYVRVSGEEQKIKGLSLEAQQERLEEYARERGWAITGIYVDAAKTARKKIHKRVEFQKMIESVKRDEVDVLLFTRLDRWFRSVGDYYKVMEILDAHGCGWKTTDEEYDTTTANGRLYINVKLSIAQNEADICGERIDVVFDSKITHGTVISGATTFGYRINEEKKLEIEPEDAAIVRDAFDRFETTVTQQGTVRYIREKYGVNWCLATFKRMLTEKLYTGVYDRGGRYNSNFCPAIIEQEQFDRVQELLKRNARCAPAGRVYIFTSILKCAECNHSLIGRIAYKGADKYYYRCNQHFQRGRCIHKKEAREDRIEEWLLANLATELERSKFEWHSSATRKKRVNSSSKKAALKNKLTKLKELYVNDLIDIEEYKKDFEIYTAALNQIPELAQENAPNFAAVEKLLQSDFRALYDNMSREEKRTLWRSIIKEIRVDNDMNITGIIFA